MRQLCRPGHFICFAATLVLCAPALAVTPPDFDKDIKPVLERHCFECHGPEKQKGGLRLDVKPAVLRGGDSGEPAVVPGNSVKSHLLKLVTSTDPDEAMPPKNRGERLKAEEVALLQRWIETGAHWVDTNPTTQPLEAGPERKITEQDRQFWSFVPPRMTEPPPVKNQAWPHTRIDKFILAKLESRDLEPEHEAPPEVLIRRVSYDLTGLPPTPRELDEFLADQAPGAYERLVDRLLASPRLGERLASLWLPLARYAEDQAHQVGKDTKFFYPNAWKYREWVVSAFNRDLPYDRFIQLQIAADKVEGAAPEDQAALGFIGLGPKYYGRSRLSVMADEWEDRVDTVTRTTLGLTVACARCHDHKFDPVSARDYHAIAGVFASTRMVNKTPDGRVQKADLKAEQLDPETLHVVEDGDVQDLNLFIRGNVERKGPAVPRGFLSILSRSSEPVRFTDGSGRRELAMAITDRGNPLAARVMVNRLWGLMYGKPLVSTPSNFGRSGQPPTHPELLDDLAARFMEGGWSVKALLREMAVSAAYRQSAGGSRGTAAVDPTNTLLWRMNRRRMTVEQWRDTILYVSGTMQTGGGKSIELDDPGNHKRTLYARISRLKLNDLLTHFDYPDANVHAEFRSVTNTPAQKLFMLNSPFMLAQAKAFAGRVAEEAPAGDEARVRHAYRLLFAREPDRAELQLATEFLGNPATAGVSRWEQYAQALLASNEALYVD